MFFSYENREKYKQAIKLPKFSLIDKLSFWNWNLKGNLVIDI